jgi:hypothetical protein
MKYSLFKRLSNQAAGSVPNDLRGCDWQLEYDKIFAELIVRECCLALWTEECHTSDLAFDEVKRNATRIKEYFGIDPREITTDMLDRSIKWMEKQLAENKNETNKLQS